MLCSASSRFWRSPALVAVLVIVMVSFIGAQPAARRSETNSADNGLRQSHSPRHRTRTIEPRRILCGQALRDELARVCAGRGYNGFGARPHSSSGFGSGGAANHCCDQNGIGCNRRDLDSYCNPALNDTGVLMSVEQVSESASASSEAENTETSNNQLRISPVVQEEPKSVDIATSSQVDTETENAIHQEATRHTFYVKTNHFHLVNSPVTTRRQSTIR